MFSIVYFRIDRIKILLVLVGFSIINNVNIILFAQDYKELYNVIKIIENGDYKKSISLLKKYNQYYPDRVDGIILLGQIYMTLKGYNNQDFAELTFREGLKRDPNNKVILQFLTDLSKKSHIPQKTLYYLKRSFKVNPNNPEVLGQLIDYYVSEGNEKDLQNLESTTVDWVNANPDSISGYVSLGRLYLSLRKVDKAIEVLKNGLKKDINCSSLQRTLAEAYLFKGNGSLFTETYYYWLAHENDPKILESEFQLFELAISDETAKEFREIPQPEKANYLINYWRAQDPNPITIQNERLIEHFQRIEYAGSHFMSANSPLGFDDRGKVYVRWGPPEEKYANSMPVLDSGIDDNFIESARTSGNIATSFPPTKAVRGNESWYYPSIGYYMAFDFVSYGGYYNEVPSLVDAIVGSKPGPTVDISRANPEGFENYFNWKSIQQMYKERSHLGGIYASLAGRSVDAFANDLTHTIPLEKISTVRNHKPRYELSLAIAPLDFTVRPIQFRGDSGLTKVDFLYGLELNQLKPVSKPDSGFIFRFQNDLVFFDSLNRRTLHRQFQQEYVNSPYFDYAKMSFTGECKIEIIPGKHEMAFQMIETSNKKGNIKKEKILIRDFIGNELMISDLKLSPQIKVIGIDEKTGRENLNILPYPFTRVVKNQQIFVYFEIYNLLLTPDQKSRYEISLKMEREIKKGEYAVELLRSFGKIFTREKSQQIETSYQRQGNNQTAREYIELDLSGLKPGHSRLTVTVNDMNVGKHVDNSMEFNLVK